MNDLLENETEELEIEELETDESDNVVYLSSHDITVYFRQEKDYLHITGNPTYPSPDIERTLSENGFAIIDNH